MVRLRQERRTIAAQVAPVLRGLVSADQRQILRFEDDEDVLAFASSQDAPRLTKIGAACPDHLVHTKPWPLLVEWTPVQGNEALVASLRPSIAAYVEKYRHYLEANAQQNLDPDAATPVYRATDAAADPHPHVILIPGVGMFTTGKDAMMAHSTRLP
jgi:rhamnose utilization protein RhaD (predicted bifunctional aldolase and dehydrogenase)